MPDKNIKTKYRNCPICKSEYGIIFTTINNYNIIKCKCCKMVFVDINEDIIYKLNNYSDETLFQYYINEPIYTIQYYDNILKRISKHFKNKTIKILDFGCGAGMFMRRARKYNIEVFGLDYSQYAQRASELFNLEIDVVDIKNTKYFKEQFDVIISHATFEHLYNPLEIGVDLLKLLKKDGLFIISGVPNFNTVTIKLFNNFWNNEPEGHVNHFEISSLKKLYNALNIKTITAKSYGWNVWYLKYLKNKIFQNNKSNVELTEIKKNDTNISIYDNINPKVFHKLIVTIYRKIIFPGIGQSLEIWGIKK